VSTRSGTGDPDKPEGSVKTVFLDRDGVINRKMPEGEYVFHRDHLEILPGVLEAIATLNRRGLRVIVVTNQRGVALGRYTQTDVQLLHAQLQQQLAEAGAWIDSFYFCPHDNDQCNCRKPLPGLFEQAQADFPEIEASTSMMIGDSLSDIEFGKNLGMKTVLVGGNAEGQKPGASTAAMTADFNCRDLFEAVKSTFNPRC
jgi:D-glycero-D-manno-heptose 1,7-bisphosphate phosphatase